MTGREMCERIAQADFLVYRETGAALTPKQIWNYSPSGELDMIWPWHLEACTILGIDPKTSGVADGLA